MEPMENCNKTMCASNNLQSAPPSLEQDKHLQCPPNSPQENDYGDQERMETEDLEPAVVVLPAEAVNSGTVPVQVVSATTHRAVVKVYRGKVR